MTTENRELFLHPDGCPGGSNLRDSFFTSRYDDLWRRGLLGVPEAVASECGRLCRGDGAHGRGARAAGGSATRFLPENCLQRPTAGAKVDDANRAFFLRRAVARWTAWRPTIGS
jgi:hypothetical protein